MNAMFSSLVAVVFLVIGMNFFFLYVRFKRDRRPKITKAAPTESVAAEKRDKEIWRRIENEQEKAANYAELQNKTLDLFEQVRENAKNKEITENKE